MKGKRSGLSSLNFLSSMTDDFTPFKARFMMLSITKKPSPMVLEALLFCFEYGQLFSQAAFANYFVINNLQDLQDDSTRIITAFIKIFNPVFFLDFVLESRTPFIVMMLLMLQTILKILLFSYVILVSMQKVRNNRYLIGLWRVIFLTQSRILYYWVTSAWVRAFVAIKHDLYNVPGSDSFMMVLCAIFMVFEIVLTIYLQHTFVNIMPSKSVLSAKDYTTEMITFSQKFIMQIFSMISPVGSAVVVYIMVGTNFVISCIREKHYFSQLPVYKFRVLIYKGALMMVITVWHVICIMEIVLVETDYIKGNSKNFALLGWIVLSILGIATTLYYFKNKALNLILGYGDFRPEVLIHKINLLKELQKDNENLNKFANKNPFNYLISVSLQERLVSVFGLERNWLGNGEKFNINCKAAVNKLFIQYLERLSGRFPRNKTIKLLLAFYYVKSTKAFGSAMKILVELQNSPQNVVSLNASLLIHKFENMIKIENDKARNRDSDFLDLAQYIQSVASWSFLKVNMRKQVDSQLLLCREMMKDNPDLMFIFKQADQSEKSRNLIEGKMCKLYENLPESHLEPYMISAYYELIVNHNIPEYLTYEKSYIEQYRKHERYFKAEKFSKENMFQKENGFLVLKQGKIMFCSQNLERYFSRIITGEAYSSWALPLLQNFVQEKLQNLIHSGQHLSPTPVMRDFLYYAKEKYIIEFEYAMNVYQDLSDGLSYVCLIRPIPNPKEHLLVNENGNIEAFTKYIGKQLGLFSSEGVGMIGTNIKEISPELARATKAFNQIDHKEKAGSPQTMKLNRKFDKFQPSALDLDSAKELYNKYSVIQKLLLKPIEGAKVRKDKKQGSLYYCKMENKSFGSVNLKFIEIEKVKKNNRNQQQQVDSRGIICSLENEEEENIETLSSLPRQAETLRDRYSTILMKNIPDSRGFPNSDEIAEEIETPPTVGVETRPVLGTTTECFDPLISPTSMTQRELLFNESPRKPERKNLKKKFDTQWLKIEEEEEDEEAKIKSPWLKKVVRDDLQVDARDDDNDSRASRRSASTGLKVMKAYNKALKTKYYAGPYKTFLVFISLILIVILSMQFNLTQTLNEDITDLKAKKEAIIITDSKNDALLILQRILRYFWMFGTGQQEVNNYYTSATLALIVTRKSDRISYLAQTNEAIPSIVDLVRDSSRAKIFANNVRMYYTNYSDSEQEYTKITNFQALNEIISDPIVNSLDYTKWTTADLEDLEIILRNMVNDLLVTNEEITSIFFNSTEYDRNSASKTINITFVVVMILLLFLILGFCSIIWLQYKDRKKNMISFVRINPEVVQKIMSKLEAFDKSIQEQISFEELPDVKIGEYFYQYKLLNNSRNGKKKQKIVMKDPNYGGIIRQYFVIFLKFFLALSLFIIMLIITFVFSTSLNNNVHDGVVQLYNSDTLKLQLKLASPTFFDLLAEKNSTQILNRPVYTQAQKAIENYKNAQTKVFDILFDDNGQAANSAIDEIVRGDGCKYYQVAARNYCNEIGTTTNLVQLISKVESILVQIFQEYVNSDQSASSLEALILQLQEDFIPYWSVTSSLYDRVSTELSDVIDERIVTGEHRRRIVIGFFYTCLALTYVFIYFIVFGEIREGDNAFKTVLKTMPPNAVLVNYTLKTYLLKSSNGSLDYVKNEI